MYTRIVGGSIRALRPRDFVVGVDDIAFVALDLPDFVHEMERVVAAVAVALGEAILCMTWRSEMRNEIVELD